MSAKNEFVPDNQLLSKKAVKEQFNLTDRLIELLGPPDAIRPNPYYASAKPMQLFRRDRVEKWIAEHSDLLAAAAKRRAAAKRATRTKYDRTWALVEPFLNDFKIERQPLEKIRREAELYYLMRYRDFEGPVSTRALVAYIRHNYTNYEEILCMIRGRVGSGDVYLHVRARLDKEICRVYALPEDAIAPPGEGEVRESGGPENQAGGR